MARSGLGGSGESEAAVAKLSEERGFARVKGESPAMRLVVQKAQAFARRTSNVLLLGETGTGKGVLASAIHYGGCRYAGPFIPINCAALPAEIIESELFGCVAGAFSGARTRGGLFEEANGGTIFLDEVNSMPLHLQPKILTAIQDRAVRRLGEGVVRKIDVRIIAAANADLMAAAERGEFRSDLFYRLGVLVLNVPALREHREDIPALAKDFLQRLVCEQSCRVREDGTDPDLSRIPTSFSPEALEKLVRYDWPGNIREMENAIERAAALCMGEVIGPGELDLTSDRGPRIAESLLEEEKRLIAELEKRRIREALERNGYNYAQSAKACHLSRRTFCRKAQKHGLDIHKAELNM